MRAITVSVPESSGVEVVQDNDEAPTKDDAETISEVGLPEVIVISEIQAKSLG